MFSIFSVARSKESLDDLPVGATRQVDLSGNIFSFSMPENFSKDMPAAPLINVLNVENQFSDTLLIERWWDFKKPGWFGSSLGTVMMTISVLNVPQNRRQLIHGNPYDPTDRLGLILLVEESLNNRYRDENGVINELYEIPGLAHILGTEMQTTFRDEEYNGQKWLRYSCLGPDSQLIVNYALPVNMNAYIEVSFIFAPDNNVLPREFREYAYPTTEKIQNSFHLEYKEGNPLKQIVENKWMEITTDEAVNSKRKLIIQKLFGPDALKLLN